MDYYVSEDSSSETKYGGMKYGYSIRKSAKNHKNKCR